MFRLVVASCLLAACAAQVVDDKDAKILKEQRFNAGDGRAGAAFATENGVIFREESDENGNRIGQYSYIGEDGQTYTVKYSAGKDGFRILEGSHIRATGQDAAPFVPENEPAAPAAPVRAAAPTPIVQAQPVAVDYADYDDTPVDPNFNPFINPHDPTHRNFQFNKNGADFAPKQAPAAVQANLVPDCADCAGVNPFINPFDASHQGGLLAGHLAGAQPQVPIQKPAPLPARQQVPVSLPAVRTTTPAAPTRFFPPGQLKLNRFETGFNFDFES